MTSWVLVAGGFHRNGGMDRCNWALAHDLAERSDAVHLVCHDADADLLRNDAVRVHVVAKPAASFMFGGLLLAVHGRKIARKVSLRYPGTRVLVNGGNCDWPDINWVHYVHHAWRYKDDAWPAWLKMKGDLYHWLSRRRERVALQMARVLIANSERTRRDLINYIEIEPDRIHTVYPGVDPDLPVTTPARRAGARAWLKKDERKPLVVFVGGLGYDSRKGFDVLFSAWRRLCALPDWDADLIVAGGGREADFWRRQIAGSPVEGRITLLGFTNRVSDLLAAADLLVSPVRYESYGLNVVEAICCGVPAIVTESAGVAERYPAELRELLIPNPDDLEDLVARMLRWHRCITHWKRAIVPFSQRLRRHTLEVMARELVAIARSNPFAECHDGL